MALELGKCPFKATLFVIAVAWRAALQPTMALMKSAFEGLVDFVLHLVGSGGHATVDGYVDCDRDDDVVGGFHFGREKALEGGGLGGG